MPRSTCTCLPARPRSSTQRVALIPEAKRNSWRYHPVVAGDTLASVAQEYRVPVAELASVNQLSSTDSVAGIDALVVPVASGRRAVDPHSPVHRAPRRYPGHHRRPLWRLSQPITPLERNPLWHPGRAGTPPAGGRARPGPHVHRASPPDLRNRRQGRRQRPPKFLRVEAGPSAGPPGRPLAPSPAPHTSLPAMPSLRPHKVKNRQQTAFDACVLLVFMCKL